MKKVMTLLLLSGLAASAQTITQTFGSGANAFSIDFVQIGNPGNAADTTGAPNPAGSVSYVYNIAKYEVSRDMIQKAGEIGILMNNMSVYDGGSDKTISWTGGGVGGNKPATGISWYEAARFVNYLNSVSGGVEAYKFDVNGNFQLWSPSDAGYNGNNRFRNSLAKFFLPSTDEWYKAAYGSPQGAWFDQATGSDASLLSVTSGTDADTAVFNIYFTNGPAEINNAGGLSAWGTMAQGGNVAEWLESASDGINDTSDETRSLRGGAWINSANELTSQGSNNSMSPSVDGSNYYGFRVAMVPEPSSLSLLLAGGAALMAGRRRK